MIGRNVNFRYKYPSSVFNNPFKFENIKRIFGKDGQVIVDKILEEKPVFLVVLHEILGYLDVFFETFDKNVLILEIIRHPIDIIFSWYQKGWGGGRFTADPRAFGLTYQSKIGIAPLPNL